MLPEIFYLNEIYGTEQNRCFQLQTDKDKVNVKKVFFKYIF